MPKRGTIRLTVVDDESSMLKLCRVAFGEMGYEVSEASSGDEFLKNLEKSRLPDVVLLDIMMPDKSGFDICRIIKQDPVLKKIKVILFTALSEKAVKYEAQKAQADAWVTKGIDLNELSDRIKAML
jgi:CheY-like chemotaxis protein